MKYRFVIFIKHYTLNIDLLFSLNISYHLFTETEGNSVFCGPETVDVETSKVEGPQNTLLSRGLSRNKCFIIYQ